MTSIKTYLNSLGRATRTTLLALAVVFVSAGIAQAATTISTNVTTAGSISTTGSGTLSIAGLATFLGGATTTQLTLLSGDTIKNESASSTSVSGALTTTGAFTATGLATFLGGATTTQMTFLSGDTIKNEAASTTAVSGTLTANANLTLLNAQAATSTLTAACIISTATSSATKIRFMFNTQATTTINGSTAVQGVVLWGYGSTCP